MQIPPNAENQQRMESLSRKDKDDEKKLRKLRHEKVAKHFNLSEAEAKKIDQLQQSFYEVS